MSKDLDDRNATLRALAALNSISGVKAMALPEHRDARGSLVALDEEQGMPFPVRRVFYIHAVPAGKKRAGHAVSCEFLIVPVSGCVRIHVNDGTRNADAMLRDPGVGVHTMPGVVIELSDFSADAVLLVLSSKLYSEVEYFSAAS